MNIKALMNVTTANGYTPAEVAVAQSKLEKIPSYDKINAIHPEPVAAPEDEYLPIDKTDSVFYVMFALVLNTVIYLTAERK